MLSPLLPSTGTDPHGVAVDDGTSTVTWEQLERNARRVANGLTAAGVTDGSTWAILAHNSVAWVEMFLGNTMAGTKYVPLNWHLTVPELVYLLQNSGATFLVVDESLEKTGREAATAVGIPADRILVVGSTYEAWRDSQPDDPPAGTVAGSPLQYTGGTTGASKGVVRPDQGVPLERWGPGMRAWGGFVQMPEQGLHPSSKADLTSMNSSHQFRQRFVAPCACRHCGCALGFLQLPQHFAHYDEPNSRAVGCRQISRSAGDLLPGTLPQQPVV
ncbi:MAG: hypothetical protein EBT79_14600, partial [Actinobacteria bacterium]|nr:hypothetical protein [Actinomycetota bacterium]